MVFELDGDHGLEHGAIAGFGIKSNCEPYRSVARVRDSKGNTGWGMSDAFRALRRLTRVKFHVMHRGKTNDAKVYTVKSYLFDACYGAEGANAKTVTFEMKDPKSDATSLLFGWAASALFRRRTR